MRPPTTLLLSLLTLPSSISALPGSHHHLTPRQTQTTCQPPGTTLPHIWSLHDLKVTYPPSTNPLGTNTYTASFAITDTRSNTTQTLKCTLRAGYQCTFTSTPRDPNLYVYMQLNLAAYFSFVETKTCGGGDARGNSTITGTVEVEMDCVGESLEEGMVCNGPGSQAFVDGVVDAAADGTGSS
ncbi:hypothetical protein QBC47DRAFT_359535 [Echria macrotheca]|uniref:AA1-like domain-containing protein n=1 Tax=Echria macrotheca TaxID=438768 RepID=A0AAJ0BFQ6_9PEZI|nr:hypothetical protein QBC47DRAFT_359535 [Echria macrotheca]